MSATLLRKIGTTRPAAHAAEPAGDHGGRASRWGPASLALVITAAFMVVLDFSIVNVAVASIERELHAGASSVQWVITGYAIAFGGLLVLGGRVADLFGRRRMFVAGLLVFSLASLAGGMAGNITELVVARAVQGIGAAIVAPAALSLITTNTPRGPERGRALGAYGATASVGFVAGLVLGGVLVQFFDWRAILWVNVPIGLLAAALAPVLVPAAPPAASPRRLDLGGSAMVTLGVTALVYAVSEGAVAGWLSWRSLGGAALAVAFIAAFAAIEQRHPAPLVRLGILRNRELRDANLVTILLGAWSAAEVLVAALFLQLVMKYSPLAVGFAIAPQGIVGFFGASSGARLARRLGTRRLLRLSTGTAALGLALLGVVLGARSYPALVVALGLVGFGTATTAFATTVAGTEGVTPGEQGLAGGLVNMSRQVGAAIGAAVAAAIIGTATVAGASLGADRLAFVAATGTALGALLILLVPRSRLAHPKARAGVRPCLSCGGA